MCSSSGVPGVEVDSFHGLKLKFRDGSSGDAPAALYCGRASFEALPVGRATVERPVPCPFSMLLSRNVDRHLSDLHHVT